MALNVKYKNNKKNGIKKMQQEDMALRKGGNSGGRKRRRAAEIGFCRSRLGGGYLLSHFRSTIGVVRLNFSVRNGKRWDPHAITTLVRFVRPGRGWGGVSVSSFLWLCLSFFRACDKVERNHTGNACICLLCSLGVCGDSLMWNRGCDLWV